MENYTFNPNKERNSIFCMLLIGFIHWFISASTRFSVNIGDSFYLHLYGLKVGTKNNLFCKSELNMCFSFATKLWRSFEAPKIFVQRSIFVFIFSSYSDAEESLKLRRFKAEDCEVLLWKFNNILDKIVWKSLKICTFLKTLNFNFPHKMLCSTTGKICSHCCLKENF